MLFTRVNYWPTENCEYSLVPVHYRYTYCIVGYPNYHLPYRSSRITHHKNNNKIKKKKKPKKVPGRFTRTNITRATRIRAEFVLLYIISLLYYAHNDSMFWSKYHIVSRSRHCIFFYIFFFFTHDVDNLCERPNVIKNKNKQKKSTKNTCFTYLHLS